MTIDVNEKFICIQCNKPFAPDRLRRATCQECLDQRNKFASLPDGSTYLGSAGYIMVKKDGFAIKRCRQVMEEKLGRPLKPREAVHHIDGNRQHDDPSNLELWLTNHPNGVRARDLVCPHCGRQYV